MKGEDNSKGAALPQGEATTGGSDGGAGRAAFRRELVEVGLVFGFFLVAVAIRAYNINLLALFPDELTYSSRAVEILGGGWAWPVSSMYDQPPLLTYVMAAVMAIGGSGIFTLRLSSVVAGAAAVPIAYYLGASMYGSKAGVVAAVGIAFDRYQILYSRLLYIEALASTLILAAVLLFWVGVIKKRDTKLSILGGVVLGLALDSKYIGAVAAVAMVAFLVWYRIRLEPNFPRRQAFLFFLVAGLMFVPVVLDLAIHNANPFYYDLVYRFQLRNVSVGAASVASGALFFTAFSRFTTIFFRVSPSDPSASIHLVGVAVPIWSALVAIGIVFFAISLLRRRKMQDGLLLIMFLALLAFAVTYPDKKAYFYMYPSLVFLVMVGGLFEVAFQRAQKKDGKFVRYASLAVVGLIVGATAFNIATLPLTYQQGFGDYDEIIPIMNYIKAHPAINSSLATSNVEMALYVAIYRANLTVFYMREPVSLYSQSPTLYNLEAVVSGTYPIYWVITPEIVIRTQPMYVIMPNVEYQTTTQDFRQFLAQHYYQPLATHLILFWQLRNATTIAHP